MRCSGCGFPLSPSRKVCPRCGTAVEGKAEKSQNVAESTPTPPRRVSGALRGKVYLKPAQEQESPAASSTWGGNTPPGGQSSLHPAGQEIHEPLTFNSPLSDDANTPTVNDQLALPGSPASSPASVNTVEPETRQPSRFSESPISSIPLANTPLPPTDWTPRVPFQQAGNAFSRPDSSLRSSNTSSFLASKLTPRFGFTIAGSFIATGMLLLIFVFLISLSLPPSSISSSQTAVPTATTKIQNTPTNTNGASTPTASTSPTATTSVLSGKQFLDNAQTASAVNPNTATATQVSSNFKVHQQIYVTFAVHTNQSGRVCLLWFLNEKQFDNYEFPIDAMSTSAYSYTTANTPGAGYVQIYWATRADCSDKLLAQQVSFTVTT